MSVPTEVAEWIRRAAVELTPEMMEAAPVGVAIAARLLHGARPSGTGWTYDRERDAWTKTDRR